MDWFIVEVTDQDDHLLTVTTVNEFLDAERLSADLAEFYRRRGKVVCTTIVPSEPAEPR